MIHMLYPFMTLEDNTEIVHSEATVQDGIEHVRVCIEKPVEGGFYYAECLLPEYTWRKIDGFNTEEIQNFQNMIEDMAHIIIHLARAGGFEDASGF